LTESPLLAHAARKLRGTWPPFHSEVCGVLTSSMSFIVGTGLKNASRCSGRRNRDVRKSVIETKMCCFAKMGPSWQTCRRGEEFQLISNSSGTASMISSASRMASSTLFARRNHESALSLTAASTLRAPLLRRKIADPGNALLKHVPRNIFEDRIVAAESSSIGIPRPIVPAPTTAMVFTSIRSFLAL